MAKRLIQASVIYRDLTRDYPVIVRGEGVYLWDADGKRYLDGSGGSSAVASIGHGVRDIAEAMASQARRIAFVPMHMFTSEPLPALAEAVAKFAPGDLNRVWFVSGGPSARRPEGAGSPRHLPGSDPALAGPAGRSRDPGHVGEPRRG